MKAKTLKIMIAIEVIALLVEGIIFTRKFAYKPEDTIILHEVPKSHFVVEVYPPKGRPLTDIATSAFIINREAETKLSYCDIYSICEEIVIQCEKFDLPVYTILGMASQESKFNPNAYRRDTQATGIFQITPIGLADYNRVNGTQLSMEEVKDINTNIKVGLWTYKQQEFYLNHYGIDYTIDDIIIVYNSGISNFRRNIDEYREYYDYLNKVKIYSRFFLL